MIAPELPIFVMQNLMQYLVNNDSHKYLALAANRASLCCFFCPLGFRVSLILAPTKEIASVFVAPRPPKLILVVYDTRRALANLLTELFCKLK
jgi:hypothetical protein